MPRHDSFPASNSDTSASGSEPAQPFASEGSPFYQVRPARQQDVRELADILASSFHTQSGLMRLVYPVLRLGIYEDLRSRLRSPAKHYICLSAVERRPAPSEPDVIIGTVEMASRNPYSWLPRQEYLYISNLAVHADYRRRGIALKLLQVCDQIAQDWGFQTICLHVLETNTQARNLYGKAGYQLQDTENDLKSFMFGQPRRLLLRKSLNR